MEQKRRLRPFGDRRTWGSFDVYPSRYGITRYRLVVFPPGMSAEERRLLRVWRSWPAWGTVLFLFTQIWLTHTVTAGWAMAGSATVWLASGTAACALAGGTRTRVRSLIAVAQCGSPEEQRLAAMRATTAVLLEADAHREAGTLTEPEHETICWQAYQRLALIGDAPAVKYRG
jgi:hypothetical protein